MKLFENRVEAGKCIAQALLPYTEKSGAVTLALPRGGVPIGYEVAMELRLPLDVYIVRKLGVPEHEGLVMGAVASDGTYIIDEETVGLARVTQEQFVQTLQHEFTELRRRQRAFRDDRPEIDFSGKTVIVVDDGLATGASMYSAVHALRRRNPDKLTIAVPVAPKRQLEWLRGWADEVVCPYALEHFEAVGSYYNDFSEVRDDEVRTLLAAAFVRQRPNCHGSGA